jgi:predicted enzyme related to lactoylglutathione lyase
MTPLTFVTTGLMASLLGPAPAFGQAADTLHLARADGERQAGLVGDQFAGRVGLFLRVDDFAAARLRMMKWGVDFVTEPRTEPYGQVAVFRDVEGNRWDLLGPAGPPA